MPTNPAPASNTNQTTPNDSASNSGPTIMLTKKKPAKKKLRNFSTVPFWMGILLSILWVGVVGIVVVKAGAAHTFAGLPLINWAIGISAIASPIALIWMVSAYLQRAADIQSVAEPLRRQLMMITGESNSAEQRIRRFNQAIREQLDLLRNAQDISHDDLMTIMERVNGHKSELESFEKNSVYQVNEIQGIVRNSLQQIENLMEDKFTMLRLLDGKLGQSGETLAKQADGVRDQLSSLLQDIESCGQSLSITLEHSARDAQKLADTAHTQEASIISAAENAAATLQDMSGKIDLNIASFLERAGLARQEADRLANFLDSQARSLDDFSNTLPQRVSDAETVLRGVADRLYASEQLAREQAVVLTDKISAEVSELDRTLEKFGDKLASADGDFQQRRREFEELVQHVGNTSTTLSDQLQNTIAHLDERAEASLQNYAEINRKVRATSDDVAAHLADTTERYEIATRTLSEAAHNNKSQLAEIIQDIATQIEQVNSLRSLSSDAGAEVEARANTALSNLQIVLDKLLTARESALSAGDSLKEKFLETIIQNENAIDRLNTATAASLASLASASEGLLSEKEKVSQNTQHSQSIFQSMIEQLTTQAQETEAAIRQQNVSLRQLLQETETNLDNAEHRLNNFASTAAVPLKSALENLENTTETGLGHLTRFSDGMSVQFDKLQQMTGRINEMGDEIGTMTSATLASIENLNERFSNVRTNQDSSVSEALSQFGSVAERISNEVATLNTQAAAAVGFLSNAANEIANQSEKLKDESERHGNKISLVTAALQEEASTIRISLQKQVEELGRSLAEAEDKFNAMGDALSIKTDDAAHILDKIGNKYNDTVLAISQDLTDKSNFLEEISAESANKLALVGDKISAQIQELTQGTQIIEAQANTFLISGGKTLIQLNSLNEKLSSTQNAASDGARHMLSELEGVNDALLKQNETLSLTVQQASQSLGHAASGFGTQASRLLEISQNVEGEIRGLNAITTAYADQSEQISVAMAAKNVAYTNTLNETHDKFSRLSDKILLMVESANEGAHSLESRFASLTNNTNEKIETTSATLLNIAEQADITITSLGDTITRQTSGLATICAQIAEQHRSISANNNAQRDDLLNLFGQINSAHTQASSAASSTISQLEQTLSAFRDQIEKLEDLSQRSTHNISEAGQSFKSEAAALIELAANAEQQTRQILSVSASLQDQAKTIYAELSEETQKSGDGLNSLISRLSTGRDELQQFSSDTETTFSKLHQSVSAQSDALQDVLRQITDRQSTMTATLNVQKDVLNELLNRVILAEDETAAASEQATTRIQASTSGIMQQLEQMERQSESTLTSIQTAASGFNEESATLAQKAIYAQQQTQSLYATVQELKENAGSISSEIKTIGNSASNTLSEVVSKLTQGHETLKETTSDAEGLLSSIHQLVLDKTDSLSKAVIELSDKQRGLLNDITSQRNTLDTLLGTLVEAQSRQAALALESNSNLRAHAEQLENNIVTLGQKSDWAVNAIEKATAAFDSETAKLTAETERAEQQTRHLHAEAERLSASVSQLKSVILKDSENTQQTLSALLNSLKNGGSELKEIGLDAESVLNGIHNSIINKSIALTTDVEKISLTQANLTEVLNEQKSTIDSILNRLVLAEDEVSAAAEKNVKRLENETESLLQQISMLEASAHKGVSTLAQQGRAVANENEALLNQSENTGKQIQNLLSVTSDLKQHSEQLRSSLQSDAGHITSTLSHILLQAEQTGVHLKDETSLSISHMQNAAHEFTKLADTNTGVLYAQTEALKHSAEISEMKLNAVGEQLVKQFNSLSEAEDKAEQFSAKLAETTEFAANKLQSLITALSESDKDSSNILLEASSRLDLVKNKLNNELIIVSQISERAVEQILSAGETLTLHSQNLRADLAASEAALSQAASLVRNETIQLPVILNRSATLVNETGVEFKKHIADIDNYMSGSAERVTTITNVAREQLMNEASNLNNVAENAGQLLAEFNQALHAQISAVKSGATTLTKEQEGLIERGISAISQLTAASERLSALRAETLTTTDRLSREFELIEQRVDSTANRLSNVTDMAGQHVVNLTQVTEKAEKQIAVSTQSFREQMERIRSGVQLQIDDINRGLMQITAQLDRTATSLRSSTTSAVSELEKISGRFEHTSKETATQLSDRTVRMRSTTEEVAQLLNGFGDQMDVLLDRLSMAGDGIKRHESDIITQLQVALSHLANVTDKLEKNRVLTADVADEAVSRLAEVATAMNGQIRNMVAGSETVTSIVKSVGQVYVDQSQGLNKSVSDAQSQVNYMNKSIEEMQQRTDRMRTALKLQGEELMQSLEIILRQLSDIGEDMSDASSESSKLQSNEFKKIS